MVVDVIMVVNYSKPELVEMTNRCISSLHESERDIRFNIIIVEDDGVDFNYNKKLCEGLSQSNNEFVILANNDLIFTEGFFSEIMAAYNTNIAESFGCWNPNWHEKYFKTYQEYYLGYEIGKHLTGWCIVTTRKVLNEIDFCNENNFRVSFWRSDDIYKDLLKQHNIKHALVRNSKVTHLLSKTLKTHSKERQIELTINQKSKYEAGK